MPEVYMSICQKQCHISHHCIAAYTLIISLQPQNANFNADFGKNDRNCRKPTNFKTHLTILKFPIIKM